MISNGEVKDDPERLERHTCGACSRRSIGGWVVSKDRVVDAVPGPSAEVLRGWPVLLP
jgi:hypothetical protein